MSKKELADRPKSESDLDFFGDPNGFPFTSLLGACWTTRFVSFSLNGRSCGLSQHAFLTPTDLLLFYAAVCTVAILNLRACNILARHLIFNHSKKLDLRREAPAPTCRLPRRGREPGKRSGNQLASGSFCWLAMKQTFRTGQLFLEDDHAQLSRKI